MKTILSIDGGGIRGIIPATILSYIEQTTGKPICELFDLVAGTSTGGILAMALATPDANGRPKYSAKKLIDFYEDRGPEIFEKSLWRKVSTAGGLLEEKYSHKNLEKTLKDYFDDTPLSKALTNILVSSYDIEHRKPFFFKSWNPKYNTHAMRKVARATSAAPTYFEPTEFKADGKDRTFVDGGVYINNPAMSAYAEAKRIFPNENDFLVVSLGTGELTRAIKYKEAVDWGLAEWAVPLLSVIFDGVSDAVDYQLNLLLKDNYSRFQTSLKKLGNDDMDDVTKTNLHALNTLGKNLINDKKAELDKVCQSLLQNSNVKNINVA